MDTQKISNEIYASRDRSVGGNKVNSRKIVGLFLKTLLLGGLAGLIVSFFINFSEYAASIKALDFINLTGIIFWYALYGFLFSIISQAGFFAYLFINQFGLGLFRAFWPTVQIVLIAFVLFDLVYFPYKGSNGDLSLFLLILMAIAILIYGIIVSRIKARQTNPRAFIPTLFLMVVITAIEWVPGLQTGEVDYAALMIFTLLICNTYQVLTLHRLNLQPTKKNNDKKAHNNQKPKHSDPKRNKKTNH